MHSQLALARGRGHPFRANLQRQHVRDDDSDLKLFALSFAAFFVCFYTFLL